MIKICFVTTTSVTLNAFVLDTAKALYLTGKYEVAFICSDDKEFAVSLPHYIRFIPVSMRRGVSLSDIKAIADMVKIFRRERFDIVQYSTPNAALFASIAAKLTGVRVRVYAQWGIRYVGMKGVTRSVFRALERCVCSLSTDIRAVSQMNLDFAVLERLYSCGKAKVLGEGGTIGVNLSAYDLEKKAIWREEIRSKLNIGNSFTFGFAGRLSVDKGGRELMIAFKRLLEAKRNVALLIVGPNEIEDNTLNELLTCASNSGRVYFTGFVPMDEMCRYYSAMDVLVHPTYREGFGMVIQEAAAMQVPIITTRIPGASEVMEEGVSCLLAEPRNVNSLYEQMQLLIGDSLTTCQMGLAARKRVEGHFERSQMINRQLIDYDRLASVLLK